MTTERRAPQPPCVHRRLLRCRLTSGNRVHHLVQSIRGLVGLPLLHPKATCSVDGLPVATHGVTPLDTGKVPSQTRQPTHLNDADDGVERDDLRVRRKQKQQQTSAVICKPLVAGAAHALLAHRQNESQVRPLLEDAADDCRGQQDVDDGVVEQGEDAAQEAGLRGVGRGVAAVAGQRGLCLGLGEPRGSGADDLERLQPFAQRRAVRSGSTARKLPLPDRARAHFAVIHASTPQPATPAADARAHGQQPRWLRAAWVHVLRCGTRRRSPSRRASHANGARSVP